MKNKKGGKRKEGMRKKVRVLKRSILSLCLCLCLVISPLAGTGIEASAAAEGPFYSQDFSGVTDPAAAGAVSNYAAAHLTIASEGQHADYLSFTVGAEAAGDPNGS